MIRLRVVLNLLPPVPTITIPESTLPPVTVDTSPQIWSICLTHADKFDRALVESWKGDMDGILIFVGGFFDNSLSSLSHHTSSRVFSLRLSLHSSSIVTKRCCLILRSL